MYNQIVYGSLLHVDELKKQNIDSKNIEFVKVKGFKRIFNQIPSWRNIDGNHKAVLNIEVDADSWFNAIAIKNLNEEYVRDLDYRERGYDRVALKDGSVTLYSDGSSLNNCIIYKGKKNKQSNEIFPNIEYFKICKNGANSHFKKFYQDYLATTYKNNLNGGIELISV